MKEVTFMRYEMRFEEIFTIKTSHIMHADYKHRQNDKVGDEKNKNEKINIIIK